MNEQRQFRMFLTVGIIVFNIIPLCLILLYMARGLLYPVVTAMLVAYILYPVMIWTKRVGIPKGITVVCMIVTLMALSLFIVSQVSPMIFNEVKVFSNPEDAVKHSRIIHISHRVTEQLAEYKIIREAPSPEIIQTTLIKWLQGSTEKIFVDVGSYARQFGQFIMIFLFVLVFALLSGSNFYKFLIELLPNSFFEAGVFILNKTTDMFGYYVRGVVVETIILGIICFLLLIPVCLLTQLSWGLALAITGLIAGTNVIRIVGPIFGGLAGVFLVLMSSTDIKAMLGVAIVAIVTQILDNMLVLPLVMREQVQIHPVICLLGVLTGGIIGGVLGMILAIPAIGGIKVIWRVFTIEMKKFNLGTALYAQHYDESSKQKG